MRITLEAKQIALFQYQRNLLISLRNGTVHRRYTNYLDGRISPTIPAADYDRTVAAIVALNTARAAGERGSRDHNT